MKSETHQQRVLELVASRGFIRSRDLVEIGVPRIVLSRMVKRNLLTRLSRGLYTEPKRTISEHTSFAEVARKYPNTVVCLLSALQFHQLTTQVPFEVWVAIPNKAYTPSMEYPPLRVVHFSGKALEQGVEVHRIGGVNVRITNVAKTVADCFKFRNKIGLDVALEALNEAWRSKRVTMDELWQAASVCRVSNVIRPYLEGLVS
jgi:predicted transcriptional regulator of viral defense system